MSRKGMFVCPALVVASIVCISVVLSGCGENGDSNSVEVGEASKSVKTSNEPKVSADLIWTNITTTSLDETQAWFVIRITNSGDVDVSGMTMSVKALDDARTIVGSDQLYLPTIPANSEFDYFGELGGTAWSSLTGNPTQIEIDNVTSGRSGSRTIQMLKTSELELSEGDVSMSFVEAGYAYNITVVVTNDTGRTLNSLVHQQVVLYDASGNPVGGGGSWSDNKPDVLSDGDSYREEWTNIPAVSPAVSASYSVWQE